MDADDGNAVLIQSAPPHFNFEFEVRQGKIGGGTCALFRDIFICKKLSFGEFRSFEYVACKMEMKCSPCILYVVIYRPPRSLQFLDHFTEMLSIICTEFDCLVISGDLNIHTDNVNDKTAIELSAILNMFGLSQHVNGPTHDRGHTLDLIITKGVNIHNVNVLKVALSDHSCIFFDLLTTPKNKTVTKSIKKRYINENTATLFEEAIKAEFDLETNDVDLLGTFNHKVLNVINAIAPAKDKLITNKQTAPWRNTLSVRTQKRECRKAERKWRKSNLQIHFEIYKEALRIFNMKLNSARQLYFSEIIKKHSKNSRILFATFDRLINPPDSISPELVSISKCDEFALFFNDKIQGIRNAASSSVSNTANLSLPSTHRNMVCMVQFNFIDDKTLEEVVSSLNSSTCCLDVLPTNFFKAVLGSLVKNLVNIVNDSLQSGAFPEDLKTAVVKPLLKKRSLDAAILNNYRPISNLPFVSKIIEKVVHQQLSQFLLLNNSFDKFQSGFRPNHSTETALIKVLNDIQLNTDSTKVSVLVLLDLSAAFDTVDYDILLQRLEHYVGLSGTVIQWFKSYLQNRKYFVSIENCVSKPMAMTCGVPQGSILGPLLFNLYMLPLGQIITKHKVNYHNYADDTQLYISCTSNDCGPIDSLCLCIEEINEWMQQNFLQLNKDKTEIIVFGPQKQRQSVISHLEKRSLIAKSQVRDLGVILDSDLNFNSHIKTVISSAYYHLKNIARVRGMMSKKDLETLIHAFVSSRLDYCNGLLTGLSKKSLHQLQLIQNAAARVLTKTRKYDHITPVLKTLHWLPIAQRIDFKILLLVYKCVCGSGPSYMSDMLKPYEPSRTLRSSIALAY